MNDMTVATIKRIEAVNANIDGVKVELDAFKKRTTDNIDFLIYAVKDLKQAVRELTAAVEKHGVKP